VAFLSRGLVLLHAVHDLGELINCLESMIGAADNLHRPGDVARLLGAAAGVRERIGSPLQPWQAPSIAAYEANARDVLGEEAYLADWQEGHALTLDEAVVAAVAFADAVVAE
jgi:hypothetical protein